MLEVTDLSRRFEGLRAVDNLSFSVEPGTFVGVIGPNGAGKTTLLNVVTGFLSPTSGQIHFDNRPIHGLAPYQICRLGIARTFQIVRPFGEMTVEDNVATGILFSSSNRVSVRQARALSEEAIDLVGLTDKRQWLAGVLTMGEKKRLELARALATRPKLLLLDEVMGGLPQEDVDNLIEVLRRVNSHGMTIVMVEHVIHAVIALTDRIVVLHFGRKLIEGTPDEVVSDPEVIECYLGQPLETAISKQ
jgi:branched-chain amino acid transport system ATP-binding protein